ncbi:hypothetical protein [Streptomyces europaeiscabiei]|uniref:hypothetical protein n=1 Tax=Streptomyces europaeiscabiei TaxID=146819 RepID=UPI0029BF3210|nr:hypothetical protein [Streptomyces europaeiscabiei]MDX3666957.1 hypothetical protein [Streptomyces europaeiscabiei]
MAIGRPSQGIEAMPELKTNVDERVAAEFRAYARQRNVSVRTVLREALYEAARERFGVDIGPAPAATAVQK